VKDIILVALTTCLWKNSRTKHLAFAGREIRFLKLFAGMQALRPNNVGDLKKS
jgi:hypothetical protein